MNKKIIWTVIILVVIGILIVAGRQFSSPVNTGQIKVGVLLPLTGTSADNGENMKRGLDIAAKEINDDPNTKYPIQLIYEDSQYKSDVAVSAATKLISLDKVKFIVGDYGSSQTIAVAPIAEKNKVILISPTSQTDKITTVGDYIFRTQISAKQEAEFFSKYLFNKIGNGKIDILAMNVDYGVSYIDAYVTFMKGLGGNTGLSQKYEANESDFRQVLLKIKDDGAKYVILVGTRKSNGLILKTAQELNISLTFFATSPTEGEELLTVAGSSAEGLIYPYPFDETSTSTSQLAYQEKYQVLYGTKSEMVSANSYDALKVLSRCFEIVGIDNEKVKNCLYDTKDYHGASGTLTFDQNGDVSKPFIIKTVKDGKFVVLEQ